MRLSRNRTLVRACALITAVAVTTGAAGPAAGSSGGVGTDPPEQASASAAFTKYKRLWSGTSRRDKRWARNTAKCESGRNPKALSSDGTYRGAFQFMKDTWKSAPKSPGGDPIDYPYSTQAVVAVALKHSQGTSPWPVCG